MDKITKFLMKLPAKDRFRILEIVTRIRKDDLNGLDIKKLVGQIGMYRVRVGEIRIIFLHVESVNEIVSIGYRSDTTYNF